MRRTRSSSVRLGRAFTRGRLSRQSSCGWYSARRSPVALPQVGGQLCLASRPTASSAARPLMMSRGRYAQMPKVARLRGDATFRASWRWAGCCDLIRIDAFYEIRRGQASYASPPKGSRPIGRIRRPQRRRCFPAPFGLIMARFLGLTAKFTSFSAEPAKPDRQPAVRSSGAEPSSAGLAGDGAASSESAVT